MLTEKLDGKKDGTFAIEINEQCVPGEIKKIRKLAS